MSTPDTIYGWHAVHALLKNRPEAVRLLYVLDKKDPKIVSLLAELSAIRLPVEERSRNQLDTLARAPEHQGIVAVAQAPKQPHDDFAVWLAEQNPEVTRLLVLDGIEDPHNLGACLRSADAFGVSAVIVPKHRGSPITPTVCKVSCGAAEVVPVFAVSNLVRTLAQMKEQGFWLVGLSGEAKQTLGEQKLPPKLALLVGAEGQGLRQLTQEQCDFVVNIPMHAKYVNCLNASVACGVALYALCQPNLK
ncbi:MAG: 23S rRNA (guanosine(2251)-2'-O)-methyltransferase RlmB [Pseudomonadota bacterium]